jgi:hypothetical protein
VKKIVILILLSIISQTQTVYAIDSCEAFFGNIRESQMIEPITTKMSAIQAQYKELYETTFNSLAQAGWQKHFQEEWAWVVSDPSRGTEKIRLLQLMGFRKIGDRVVAPNYSSLISNYITALKKAGRIEKETILPALVLVKGPPGEANGHILITPGIDPWPNEAGYRILSSKEMFNIPFRAILKGLKEGRFPLLEASHDVSHFISFLAHPEYVATLREVISKLPELEKFPRSFSRRLFYAVELLTLPNPLHKEQIRKMLLFPGVKSTNDHIPFSDYMKYFEELPVKQVIAHAQNLTKHYDSHLVDYGGGTSRSFEKNQLLLEDFALTSANEGFAFRELLTPNSTDQLAEGQRSILGKIPSTILSKLLEYHTLSEEKLKELVATNMSSGVYFNVDGKPRDGVLVPNYRERLDYLIRLQVARMEFGIWETSNQLNLNYWLTETLKIDFDKRSPIVRFFRDTYGSTSPFYIFLLQ